MPQIAPFFILSNQRPRLRDIFHKELAKIKLDLCLTCGMCASGCPATGIDDFDPRKLIRLILLGADEEVLESSWIWICTMCDRCKYVCPMGIDIAGIVHYLRGLVPKEKRPRNLQRSCELQKKSSSTGIPNEDFVWVVNEVLEEARQEPGWEDLQAPIDKVGAEYYLNQNARDPTIEPEEMVKLWKIFHVVGIDWTYSSKWWDGANYCLFTGDLEDWEYALRKQVEVVEKLGCKYFINTECGHSFYAIYHGLKRFNIPHHFKLVSIVSLYAQWIKEGRLKVDPSWNKEGLKVTVQDPCKLVRQSLGDQVAEDLRFVVKAVVGEENFVEIYPNKSNNYCCGGGGGSIQIGLRSKRLAFGRYKFEQIAATGADIVVAPCYNCLSQLADLCEHYQGKYQAVHLWSLIVKAMVR